VHGGISPNLPTVDLIRNVNRFSEVARDGIISDILWSDPEEDTDEFEKSPRYDSYYFLALYLLFICLFIFLFASLWFCVVFLGCQLASIARGAGYIFGAVALHRFNHVNGFGCVVRAHQLAMEGLFALFHFSFLFLFFFFFRVFSIHL
jgi:diadenosine tetraphosphatase ApaH/serine/threonine PP2A family protein phosphatase